MSDVLRVELPPAFQDLFRPSRYKVYWGGRGAAKSWSFARALVALTSTKRLRVLCGREFQTSIKDSVHAVLKSQISELGLERHFRVTREGIASSVGSEFIFSGLHNNQDQIKSTEGVDIFWGEEAHSFSNDTFNYLIPTIRKDAPGGPFGQGAELWFSYNQHDDNDPIHERFVSTSGAERFRRTRERSIVRPVTWRDNPYFPDVLNEERMAWRESDPDAYDWIWELQTRHIGSSIVFRGKTEVHAFERPETGASRFFFGADWGFANDPSALVRCWTNEAQTELFIDYEAFGYGVELDHLPALFAGSHPEGKWENPQNRPGIEGAFHWPIKADGARPETISYMRRQGFNIAAAEKWPGSVEDGVEHIKGFRKVHIHERCKNLAREARLYSYKVDKKTGEVLPVILDKHNHGWDATRYALDGYITARGALGVWKRAFA